MFCNPNIYLVNSIPLPKDPIETAEGWLSSKKSAEELLAEARAEETQIEEKKFKAISCP